MAALARQHLPLPDRSIRDPFDSLVDAIISQQISTAAARSVRQRLLARFNGVLDPSILAETDKSTFRSCGVSPQKASYIISLSEHFMTNHADFERMPDLSDVEVIELLTAVKGIGEWTAQMFLMFTLHRTDVFPVKDYGIRKSMHQLYGWKTPRKDTTMINKSRKWSPFRTQACLVLWRALG